MKSIIFILIISRVNCAPQNDIVDNIGVVAALNNVAVDVSDVNANLIVDLNLGTAPVTNQITTDTTTTTTNLTTATLPDPTTLTAITTATNATQQTNATGLNPTIVNDISNMFTETESIYPSLVSGGSFSSAVYTMVRDSVDMNCISNKYNDFNVTNQINIRRLRIVDMQLRNTYSRIMLLLPNLRSLSGVIMESNDRIGRLMSMVMLSFYNAVISCSGKLLPFMNYSFDLLMSHGNLVRSIMSDSTFEPYQKMIVCANNYANQNNMLDVQGLNLPFTVADADQGNCNQFVATARNFTGGYRESFLSFSMPPANRACFDITFQDSEGFFLRHILLTQVNMDAAMLSEERNNFINDFRTLSDNFFMCTTGVIINESQ